MRRLIPTSIRDDYLEAFGENMVPYNRGVKTEVGISQVTYNRAFAVDRGPAQVSSAVKSSQLVGSCTCECDQRD